MDRKSFARLECPMARAVDALADPWSLLLIRTALLGARRFQDFVDMIDVPPTTLTRKLQQLIDHGLVDKRTLPTSPSREVYELTSKGRDVLPVLLAMSTWSAKWQSPKGPPLECFDPDTDALIEAVVVDKRTGTPLVAGAVGLRAGPGASARLRKEMQRPVVLGGAVA